MFNQKKILLIGQVLYFLQCIPLCDRVEREACSCRLEARIAHGLVNNGKNKKAELRKAKMGSRKDRKRKERLAAETELGSSSPAPTGPNPFTIFTETKDRFEHVTRPSLLLALSQRTNSVAPAYIFPTHHTISCPSNLGFTKKQKVICFATICLLSSTCSCFVAIAVTVEHAVLALAILCVLTNHLYIHALVHAATDRARRRGSVKKKLTLSTKKRRADSTKVRKARSRRHLTKVRELNY